MSFRIAVDTGGTFTDVTVAASDGGFYVGKAPTTYDATWVGTREAIERAAGRAGLTVATVLEEASLFIWGTTRATNAIIEGRTARTGFLTHLSGGRAVV